MRDAREESSFPYANPVPGWRSFAFGQVAGSNIDPQVGALSLEPGWSAVGDTPIRDKLPSLQAINRWPAGRAAMYLLVERVRMRWQYLRATHAPGKDSSLCDDEQEKLYISLDVACLEWRNDS